MARALRIDAHPYPNRDFGPERDKSRQRRYKFRPVGAGPRSPRLSRRRQVLLTFTKRRAGVTPSSPQGFTQTAPHTALLRLRPRNVHELPCREALRAKYG